MIDAPLSADVSSADSGLAQLERTHHDQGGAVVMADGRLANGLEVAGARNLDELEVLVVRGREATALGR